MSVLNWLVHLLDRPYWSIVTQLDPLPSWRFVGLWVYRVIAILIIFSLLRSTYRWIRDSISRKKGRDRLLEYAEADTLVTKNDSFIQSIEAAKHLEQTVAPLKKARAYGRLGEVYASVNQPKEAAKWFAKNKDYRRAADEYAKAGMAVKAAHLLMKHGDFGTAARFYEESGRPKDAAKAYARMGNLPAAARSYREAGAYAKAADIYITYFDHPTDSADAQNSAAIECLQLLQEPRALRKIKGDRRTKLAGPLAERLERAQRYEAAAELFKESGNLVRAGEVYLLADRLEEAAQCMRAAGKDREAARIGGRYLEKRGQLKEAAQAYVQAGEYRRAADCYVRSSEMVRAAECLDKAGEFYRSAVAYAHASRFQEAIRQCQRVREDDPQWEQSRALLGRCFYELHDYAHCAAALDNFLMGKRVSSDTMEYFYMLALAYEQLGKLDESRELLYKIRTVQTEFRDVAQRISNISSRISMRQQDPSAPYQPSPAGAGNPQMMQMVEDNLGSRYQLERELGRGGMGVVYLARDKQLDRPVALKFLGSLVDDSEEYRERFVREAKAAAKVSHPNIISIYDISASAGKAYIAMEFIDGPNLHRYMTGKNGGRLTPREAINIASQACAALQAIHEKGITHRDLKPDNILLAKGGLVKLTDFGLAKAEDARITKSNMIMGTPCYMAPEQARGDEADARSDIYAMGLLLYETLTGEVVFKDGDVLTRQQIETPPPPSTKTPEIPPALDAIIMKCIQKRPQNRYQTAKELQQALRHVAV